MRCRQIAPMVLLVVALGCGSKPDLTGAWKAELSLGSGMADEAMAKQLIEQVNRDPQTYELSADKTWKARKKAGTWSISDKQVTLTVTTFDGKDRATLEGESNTKAGQPGVLSALGIRNAFEPMVFTLAADGKSMRREANGVVMTLTK